MQPDKYSGLVAGVKPNWIPDGAREEGDEFLRNQVCGSLGAREPIVPFAYRPSGLDQLVSADAALPGVGLPHSFQWEKGAEQPTVDRKAQNAVGSCRSAMIFSHRLEGGE